MPRSTHREPHYTHRIGWLRASVLGANDGIVSTSALVVGVAAAESGRSSVLIAGLAHRLAEQLTAGDPLTAHARDELGITEAQAARPTQAALASAATFSVGAALPLALAALVPARMLILVVSAGSLAALAALGALAAGAGGASRLRGAARVTFWSALALLVTALVGRLFGTPA